MRCFRVVAVVLVCILSSRSVANAKDTHSNDSTGMQFNTVEFSNGEKKQTKQGSFYLEPNHEGWVLSSNGMADIYDYGMSRYMIDAKFQGNNCKQILLFQTNRNGTSSTSMYICNDFSDAFFLYKDAVAHYFNKKE